MSETQEKLYAERETHSVELAGHYFKHVMAMTAEKLHEKSAIAAELAYRDHVIESAMKSASDLFDKLRAANQSLAAESAYESLVRGWLEIEMGHEVGCIAGETHAERSVDLIEALWQHKIDKIVTKHFPDRDGSGSDADSLELTLAEIKQMANHLLERAASAEQQARDHQASFVQAEALVASYDRQDELIGTEFEGVDEVTDVIRLLKADRDRLAAENAKMREAGLELINRLKRAGKISWVCKCPLCGMAQTLEGIIASNTPSPAPDREAAK